MKKIAILFLAVALAACGAPAAPTEQAVAPEPAEPVVVTVVVEPTQAPAEPATAVPAEPVVVTVVVEATQVPAAVAPPTEAPAAGADAPIALDNALGKGVFTNMTMSSDNVTLRCFPRDITFNITTSNNAIVDALFYYRIADIDRLYPSEWKNFGKMTANGGGNFTLAFKGEDVNPDVRIDGGWLDFQFVGLAKSGDVVDRSQKIESLVKYTFDCP
ncbi:MAG TPA: hypothetical protein VJ987_01735 [Anaerolineales bacterium]|nr:hypothetical protein [Anaerolineales bacterium]